jgi:hypothetical protein
MTNLTTYNINKCILIVDLRVDTLAIYVVDFFNNFVPLLLVFIWFSTSCLSGSFTCSFRRLFRISQLFFGGLHG